MCCVGVGATDLVRVVSAFLIVITDKIPGDTLACLVAFEVHFGAFTAVGGASSFVTTIRTILFAITDLRVI